jgi:hypothetical protein
LHLVIMKRAIFRERQVVYADCAGVTQALLAANARGSRLANTGVAGWHQILGCRKGQTKAARIHACASTGACDPPANYIPAAFR